MEEDAITEIVDGVTFELRTTGRQATNPDWVCVRKTRRAIDRYLEMAPQLQGCRMIEVGVDQGGSTSFFLKCFKPQQLVAIELKRRPVDSLMSFLAEHDSGQRVSVHWGVNQADTVQVPRLVTRAFGDELLDLVVDDASHILAPTTSTFEMLFPRLRPGGTYVIEDWSTDHQFEQRLEQERADEPQGKVAKGIAAAKAKPGFKPDFSMPMSMLPCQLLIASGRSPQWVAHVQSFPGYCEITRGEGHIEPGTQISHYIGEFGTWMFDKTKP